MKNLSERRHETKRNGAHELLLRVRVFLCAFADQVFFFISAYPRRRACLALVSLILSAGCRQQMGQQPKYKPLEGSDFFSDGRSARKPVGGTVARTLHGGEAQPAAFKSGAAYTNDFPYPVTPELLARGRARYEINCAVCHGLAGYGDGMIVRRGFGAPPSYHRDDVRAQPVGFYFDVVTNGYGAMASYKAQVSERDRWAIIAYIRALQLSQRATVDDVPPEERSRFGGGGQQR